jgi:hypothetical protein
MVNLHRVGVEAKRGLTRSTGRWPPVAAIALACLLAAFCLHEAGIPVFARAVYLFAPLLMAPLAAQEVAGDRERGLSRVHATTPATRGEILGGRLVTLTVVLAVAVAGTLPVLYALTGTISPTAFRAGLPLVGWALLVGSASTVAGLLVGYATSGSSTRGLSVAFGLVTVWLVTAMQRRRLLAWAQGETQRNIVEGLLHANPLTWALEAEHPVALAAVANHADHATGLALLLAAGLTALAAIAIGLQHTDGWRENPLRPSLALAVVIAAAIAGGGLLATWDTPPPSPPETEAPSRATVGTLQASLEASTPTAWTTQTPLVVHVGLTGPPNTTATVQGLQLDSQNLVLNTSTKLPQTVDFDGSTESGEHGDREPTAAATFDLEATATAQRIADTATLRANLTVDDNQTRLATQLHGLDWQPPTLAVLASGLGPLVLLAGGAIAIPRRFNRW